MATSVKAELGASKPEIPLPRDELSRVRPGAGQPDDPVRRGHDQIGMADDAGQDGDANEECVYRIILNHQPACDPGDGVFPDQVVPA